MLSFGINHHQYADDTQLYISITSIRKDHIIISIAKLKKFTQAVPDRFTINEVVLNPDKSEVIILMETESRLRSLDAIDKISVTSATIQPATCLKSFVIIVDST